MLNFGHINYLNCLPLNYILRQKPLKDVRVVSQVPAELNCQVIVGNLDASPVSSIVYARHFEDLYIFPEVSITADDNVESIILVSKVPIQQLAKQNIALTAQSATSHCLLKIIMEKAYGIKPNYFVSEVSPQHVFPTSNTTATLFIGDNALYVNKHQEDDLFYYDLGHEWHKLTGQAMVYALWVTNKEVYETKTAEINMLHDYVLNGFKQGFEDLDKAIASCDKLDKFSPATLKDYLHIIKWDLGEKQIKGLKLFYEYAFELGLIPKLPTLNFYPKK